MTQAGLYENELKRILSGDEKTLGKSSKTLNQVEREHYMVMQKYPFLVVRAAGSLGVADLVALRKDFSMVVEVKARSSDKITFSHEGGRMQRATVSMVEQCTKSGVLPIFAFRRKGEKGDWWRVFTIKINTLNGKAMIINDEVPKLAVTKSSNFIMMWKDGMPLNKFFEVINSVEK